MSATAPTLEDKAATLPREPGVYLFKSARGKVLYVGKAKSLRARVRQYLNGTDNRLFVPYLVRAARDVECVVVRTEKEALILENTLIKKHRPRYNIKLVDDSSFLHLRIQPGGYWPRYDVRRHIHRDPGTRHFGPFASASRARATLEFVHRRFPLRTCTDRELKSRTRPCLMHQMGRCLAPCVDLCTKQEYDEVVQQSLLFLEGKNTELLERLQVSMADAAEDLRFEEAGRLRDLIRAIRATVEQQDVVDRKLAERDAWGVHVEDGRATVALLPQRMGKLDEPFTFPAQVAEGGVGELMSSLLNAWYGGGTPVPPLVLVSDMPDEAEALEEVLSERRGSRVHLHQPKRGEKTRLIELAVSNARTAHARAAAREDGRQAAMEELLRVCKLPRLPRRIECFDNSNIQGTDPVAAMAVFVDGAPSRADYRRYRIKTVVGADDFASMAEVLRRRITRGLAEGNLPDLMVIDGGKGQVSAVRAIFRELGIADQRSPAADQASRPVIGLVGLSKPRTEHRRGDRHALDKIILPEVANPIRLQANSPGLRLLQAIRDQTHDTAVQYHRKVRRKRTLTSALDDLPGIGVTRRKALLSHFGSAAAVRAATAEQLAEVPGFGPALAERVRAALDAEPLT
jgi:excinuclease ABC subunit C